VWLVDTNVLLDVVLDDPVWADWSLRQLETASLSGPLIVNPIIYTELSMAFARIEQLEAVLAEGGLEMHEVPREALFLAGKVFLEYRRRRRSSIKRNVLPDFFIGAHAAVQGFTILTRDVGRYRNYFPTVKLVHPSPQSA
jgi:predicted nucleic acid-binding protein